jgi:hypothetical protein
MKIDKAFIDKYRPCDEALTYLKPLLESNNDAVAVLEHLIENEEYGWAQWGMARCLSNDNARLWALKCAEAVLPILEAAFPHDSRPRRAFEAAKSNTVTAEILNVVNAAYSSYHLYACTYTYAYATAAAVVNAAYSSYPLYDCTYIYAYGAAAAAAYANPDLQVPLLLLGLDMLQEQEK